MLKDEDRIFKNLYNDFGNDLMSSQKEEIGVIQKKFWKKEEIGLLMKLKHQN